MAADEERSPLSKLAQNGAVVGGAAVVDYGARFVRNVCLARLLSQADFGVCIAITTLLTSAQLLTNFGFEKLLIQEREISDTVFQPVLASLVLTRMILAGFVVFVLAGPMAEVFGVPEASSAFRILALSIIPLGFVHMDTTRFQKSRRFVPDAAVTVALPLVDLVVAVVGTYFFRTYEVLPYSFLVATIASVLVSFYFAERPFRLKWESHLVKHALRFGMPLVGGGVVMLAASQADRVIIGASLGVKDLAVYSTAVAMISAPSMLLTRVGASLFLPSLAAVKLDNEKFSSRYLQVGIVVVVVTAVILVPLMLFGRDFTACLYGARYRPTSGLIWTICIGQAAFLIRFWPNLGALARGDTNNLFLSNIFRISGVILAVFTAHLHLGVIAIAGAFAVGEIMGLAGALWMLLQKHPELRKGLPLLLAILTATLAICAWATTSLEGNLLFRMLVAPLLVCGFLYLVMRCAPEARRLAILLWDRGAFRLNTTRES